jgi:hypothetical protein
MPPQNRNENGMEVERPIHRIVSRGELSVGSDGNEDSSLNTPRSAKEYNVRRSSLIGYVCVIFDGKGMGVER